MENSENNPIETCVVCGGDTPYRFQDNINMRIGYVEGIGQTCKKCYLIGSDQESVSVPSTVIKNTPNNYELGEKVRALYNKKYTL